MHLACACKTKPKVGSTSDLSSQNIDEMYPLNANSYTLLRKLGSGSFGVVWKARENVSGDIIAIKQVRLINFYSSLVSQKTYSCRLI